MKIAICAKQVPEKNEGGMDVESGLIKRNKTSAIINIYDLSAIEAGLLIKDTKDDAQVDVFTMAPQKGIDVLYQTSSMGCDDGYLISDIKFGGSDILATSYTLSMAIKGTNDYDLIICGKQTTDGDTSQISSEISAWLDIPYIANVYKIKSITDDKATFIQKMDAEEYEVEVNFPCVINVLKEMNIPRIPTLKLKLQSKNKKFKTLNLENIPNIDISRIGVKGSATKVKKVFPTPIIEKQNLISLNAKDASKKILELLDEDIYHE
jgi:electron transfer flavoprotein beta subunit